MNFEQYQKFVKKYLSEHKEYMAEVFIPPQKGLDKVVIMKMVFDNDKDKKDINKKVRTFINDSSVDEYFTCMDAWMSRVSDGKIPKCRPVDDPNRTQALIVCRFCRDMNFEQIIFQYDIIDDKVVWGTEQSVTNKSTDIVSQSNVWNFFVEDSMSEVYTNNAIKQKLFDSLPLDLLNSLFKTERRDESINTVHKIMHEKYGLNILTKEEVANYMDYLIEQKKARS